MKCFDGIRSLLKLFWAAEGSWYRAMRVEITDGEQKLNVVDVIGNVSTPHKEKVLN